MKIKNKNKRKSKSKNNKIIMKRYLTQMEKVRGPNSNLRHKWARGPIKIKTK